MKRKPHNLVVDLFLGLTVGLFSVQVLAQPSPADTEIWEPVPETVTGVIKGSAPSDAIVLFDGENTDAWEHVNDASEVKWTLTNGEMQVNPRTGSIRTRQSFGDVQLHIEWRATAEIVGSSQSRGNSGVFLQSLYEVQVLDSYDNPTYVNGQAGAVYKQHIPLVNASNQPGDWQVYDIIFSAPMFNAAGEKESSGYVTVLHNGVLVQNHVEILGSTENVGPPLNNPHGDAPIELQDHGQLVSFRNIWIREL